MAYLVFILPPLLAPPGVSLQIRMAQCSLSSAGIIAIYTYLSTESEKTMEPKKKGEMTVKLDFYVPVKRYFKSEGKINTSQEK